MRNVLFLMGIATIFTGFLSCANHRDSPKKLKLSFNQGVDHPQYKAMQQFASNIVERTNGEYDIELYPNELLGAQKESLELLQSGIIHMAIISSGTLENISADFAVFNLPYVFDSMDHQMAVISDDSIVGNLYKSMHQHNVHILGGYHVGSRSLYTKSPINHYSDLSGMKIRVMESAVMLEMIKRMGGTPTPLAMGEVYTAIQQGVIDGAENNEISYVQSKNSEVAPYFTYTNHMMIPDFLIINAPVFERMDIETRAIFEEEFSKSVALEINYWAEDTVRSITSAIDLGTTFIHPNIDDFKTLVVPMHDQFLKTPSAKKLYDDIRRVVS